MRLVDSSEHPFRESTPALLKVHGDRWITLPLWAVGLKLIFESRHYAFCRAVDSDHGSGSKAVSATAATACVASPAVNVWASSADCAWHLGQRRAELGRRYRIAPAHLAGCARGHLVGIFETGTRTNPPVHA